MLSALNRETPLRSCTIARPCVILHECFTEHKNSLGGSVSPQSFSLEMASFLMEDGPAKMEGVDHQAVSDYMLMLLFEFTPKTSSHNAFHNLISEQDVAWTMPFLNLF